MPWLSDFPARQAESSLRANITTSPPWPITAAQTAAIVPVPAIPDLLWEGLKSRLAAA